jgi:hypothetical protein
MGQKELSLLNPQGMTLKSLIPDLHPTSLQNVKTKDRHTTGNEARDINAPTIIYQNIVIVPYPG